MFSCKKFYLALYLVIHPNIALIAQASPVEYFLRAKYSPLKDCQKVLQQFNPITRTGTYSEQEMEALKKRAIMLKYLSQSEFEKFLAEDTFHILDPVYQADVFKRVVNTPAKLNAYLQRSQSSISDDKYQEYSYGYVDDYELAVKVLLDGDSALSSRDRLIVLAYYNQLQKQGAFLDGLLSTSAEQIYDRHLVINRRENNFARFIAAHDNPNFSLVQLITSAYGSRPFERPRRSAWVIADAIAANPQLMTDPSVKTIALNLLSSSDFFERSMGVSLLPFAPDFQIAMLETALQSLRPSQTLLQSIFPYKMSLFRDASVENVVSFTYNFYVDQMDFALTKLIRNSKSPLSHLSDEQLISSLEKLSDLQQNYPELSDLLNYPKDPPEKVEDEIRTRGAAARVLAHSKNEINPEPGSKESPASIRLLDLHLLFMRLSAFPMEKADYLPLIDALFSFDTQSWVDRGGANIFNNGQLLTKLRRLLLRRSIEAYTDDPTTLKMILAKTYLFDFCTDHGLEDQPTSLALEEFARAGISYSLIEEYLEKWIEQLSDKSQVQYLNHHPEKYLELQNRLKLAQILTYTHDETLNFAATLKKFPVAEVVALYQWFESESSLVYDDQTMRNLRSRLLESRSDLNQALPEIMSIYLQLQEVDMTPFWDILKRKNKGELRIRLPERRIPQFLKK